MSAIVYTEPYKLPAGVLALAMHAAFFALMYFGASWQALPPQGMVVDIWDSLPEMKATPVKIEAPEVEKIEPPKPPAKAIEPPKPALPPKAEIQLAEQEKKKPLPKPVEPEPTIEELQKEAAAETEKNARIEQARAGAEQAAQLGKVVDEYIGKIQAKIKSNIVLPPDVPKGARAEYSVTLLPGGTVLNVRLTKRSGDDAYDRAVERAILKSQPLPLPPDATLFKKFRDLNLNFNSHDIGGKAE